MLKLTFALYSGEVELWMSRRGESQPRFSLANLLEGVAGPDHSEPIFFQASSLEGPRVAIRAIKRLIELYGKGVLAGESSIFEAMAIAADRQKREYNNKIFNDPIREMAEAAWKSRDFAKVKQLYESLRGEPTPVEAARLEFATRHVIA